MSDDVIEIIEIKEPGVLNMPVNMDSNVNYFGIDVNEIYCLSHYAKQNTDTLYLTEMEWNVFFAFTPKASVTSIAKKLLLPETMITRIVQRLLACNVLVPEEAMSRNEYLERLSSSLDVKDDDEVVVAKEEEYLVTISVDNDVQSLSMNATNIINHQDNNKSSELEVTRKLRSLRCLVDLVCLYKGDERRGKLAIYRIFLRVPREDFVALGFGSFLFLSHTKKDEIDISPDLLDRLIQAADQELGKHPEIIMQELHRAGKLPASCFLNKE